MALILHWPDSSWAMNNKMTPKVMASPPKERTMVDVESPPISRDRASRDRLLRPIFFSEKIRCYSIGAQQAN